MARLTLLFTTFALTCFWIISCGEDAPTAPPGPEPKATVHVNPAPDGMDCPWELTGPDGYDHDGQGDETLSDLASGDYTVTWGAIPGWDTPSPASETQTVAGGGSATFTGTYAAKAGTITVNAEPDVANAPWQLTGPDSYVHDGQGDETLSDLDAGDYTLTWGAVSGWDGPAPASETKTLAMAGSAAFSGTYAQQVGTVIVDAEPDAADVPWQLTSPAGYVHDGHGDETLPGLATGDYTLTWGSASGWDSPSPASETKSLTKGGTVTFSGSYLLQPGTVALGLANVNAGETGYVRVADAPGLRPTEFTIEAWITPQGPGVGATGDWWGAHVIGKPIEGVGGNWLWSWAIAWSPVNESVSFAVTHAAYHSGTYATTADQTVPVGTTAHVAATFDGSTLSLYVDGTLEVTETFPYDSVYYGDEDVLIGAANFGASWLRRFDGIVDEVRLWDHARSAQQVADKMSCRLIGDETGLLAYWDFEDSDLTDASGNGHDGVAELTGVSFASPQVSLSGCP